MKAKKFTTLLTALLISVLFAVSAYAADGLIYFSDPESTAGSTVSVLMTVQSEGTVLGDATVTLKYPSENLEFIAGDNASGGAGTVRVHGITQGAAEGKCEYELKFQTPVAGSFTVNIDTCEVYDQSGQPVNITHLGSSSVTVNPSTGVSADSSLADLKVSPGTLNPDFSSDVFEYNVAVGLSVNSLTIAATGTESDAVISVVNNDSLAEGENDVIVFVKAPDGQSQSEYHIHAIKTEGGAEEASEAPAEPETESFAEGVQLISKGKTVTVMDLTDDVTVPEGFKESAISIDGQKVQGWIWGAEGTPQYCVVYGMNDQGELNFYRYDIKEKTIQRYFEDPMAADCIALTEYEELNAKYGELTEKNDTQHVLLLILAILLALFLVIIIYLIFRIASANKKRTEAVPEEEPVKQKKRTPVRKETVETAEEAEPEEVDETRVISRNERRRRMSETVQDATRVIARNEIPEEMSAPVTKESAPASDDDEDDGFEELDF